MASVLWTSLELVEALGETVVVEGDFGGHITGFSIDTRSLGPGEVFVALKDQRDGHEFVSNAFKAGAAAAIVSDTYVRRPDDGTLLRCNRAFFRKIGREHDCSTLFILQTAAQAARSRLSPSARLVAVTGSAGKTGTKEMLRACCGRLGKTHASEKSYNNHWGVPLTLANMPADTVYGIFEIGMNHAGEITPLTKMVRPHVAIVTTVEAVHLEHFDSVEGIADAKAEIFQGLLSGGVAIIKRDNPHYERLRVRAQAEAARVISFGLSANADVYAEKLVLGDDGSDISARIGVERIPYRLAIPGKHIVENSLAVVAALHAIGADLEEGLKALAALPPPSGRGARSPLKVAAGEALLIDESYNANPASMRAALGTLGAMTRQKFPRRIAVLGDMLELGPDAPRLHTELIDAVKSAGVDKLFACGPLMKGLYDAAPAAIKGAYAATSEGLKAPLLAEIQAGDVVMVKGSNGTRLGPIVAALKAASAG